MLLLICLLFSLTQGQSLIGWAGVYEAATAQLEITGSFINVGTAITQIFFIQVDWDFDTTLLGPYDVSGWTLVSTEPVDGVLELENANGKTFIRYQGIGGIQGTPPGSPLTTVDFRFVYQLPAPDARFLIEPVDIEMSTNSGDIIERDLFIPTAGFVGNPIQPSE